MSSGLFGGLLVLVEVYRPSAFTCALFSLCQDVPIPMFMQQKAENDWTEDEVKMAKEYERKVKELNEEREKFRKVSIASLHTDNC